MANKARNIYDEPHQLRDRGDGKWAAEFDLFDREDRLLGVIHVSGFDEYQPENVDTDPGENRSALPVALMLRGSDPAGAPGDQTYGLDVDPTDKPARDLGKVDIAEIDQYTPTDVDSTAGTDNALPIAIRVPGSGGGVTVSGDNEYGLDVDPTDKPARDMGKIDIVSLDQYTPVDVDTDPGDTDNALPIALRFPGAAPVTAPGDGTYGLDVDVTRVVGDSEDLDNAGGGDPHAVIVIGLPSATGHVVGGTATNPLRTDPTGTTSQPVTQSGHDNLQANVNLQVGDADVDATNPVPVEPGTGATWDVSDRAARDLGKVDVALLDQYTPVDVDTGAPVVNALPITWRKSGAGAPEFGTGTDPVRTDPTGTTSQPVTQSTHDNLQANVNLQVGDADVEATNPVPVEPGTGATWDVSDREARDLGKVDIASLDQYTPEDVDTSGSIKNALPVTLLLPGAVPTQAPGDAAYGQDVDVTRVADGADVAIGSTTVAAAPSGTLEDETTRTGIGLWKGIKNLLFDISSKLAGVLTVSGTVTANRAYTTITATIANGASISDEIDLGGYALLIVHMSAAWTAANLTALVSPTSGGTFQSVYDDAGNEIIIVAAAGRAIVVDIAATLGAGRFLKLRSGTTALPVAQGAERVITLVVKS